MKKPQQTHTSRPPRASTIINGHAVFASALVAGAALLTGCQSTSLGPVSYTHLTLPTICSV